MATDGQTLTKSLPKKVKTNGRPEFNRDLALRLFKAKYSTSQISKYLKCSAKTVYRIRDEFIKTGDLDAEVLKENDAPLVEADFDSECNRATGMSFLSWIRSKQTSSSAIKIFNFVANVWDQVWLRPSLVQVKDQTDQLGDQLCLKFLDKFGEDFERIRDRKKRIRRFFAFLGRHDLNDRHLTMTKSRDPIAIRRVPIIESPDFPILFQKSIDAMPENMRIGIMYKVLTQSRTGNLKTEKGFFGLKKNTGKSYLSMTGSGVNDFRCHQLEKMNEEWDITYLPEIVRKGLWEIYQKIQDGEQIFQFNTSAYVKIWKINTKKIIGTELSLHDLRKISVTWFYVCGLPLEIATSLNVGWKDLNTPRDHYLHMRQLLKKSQKKVYKDNIPNWFKDELNEYLEDEK